MNHLLRDPRSPRGLIPPWEAPATPPPGPPAPPPNANVRGVVVTINGAVIVLFDIPVIIDAAHPPTTWQFGEVTSFGDGGFDIGTASFLRPDGTVNPGDAVIIADNDPAARTVEGGFVNGTVTTVSSV